MAKHRREEGPNEDLTDEELDNIVTEANWADDD